MGYRLGITVALALGVAAAAFAAFSTAGVRDDAAPTTTVKVGVREWAFDLSQESAPAGTVTFAITNTGQSEPHDFAVDGRTSAVVMPGESTTLTVDFDQPGVYPYVDTRADTDHEMYGSFTVTGTVVTTTAASTTVAQTTTTATPTVSRSSLPLKHVADAPLPGEASRFDYQSVDPSRRRLFIAHMGDGHVVVFDLARRRVVKDIPNVPDAHGVLVAPKLRRLYVAATGDGQLVTFEERTFRQVRRSPAGSYPDGIAYDSRDELVFVSDESGHQEKVFHSRTGAPAGSVALPADAGNVQYDAPSRRILVAAGSKNVLAVIDPRRRRIVRQVELPGCDHAHGLHLDTVRRLAFVACEGNAKLLLLDLKTMRVLQTQSVGDDPDVLDFDPGLRRLYVAAESGVVSVFAEKNRRLTKIGEAKLEDNAHSVAVDPRTHLVYFPLEDVGGKPVLRIMRPTETGRAAAS
jgi:DNA-binding beta-propeller fold protein YncE